MTVTSLDVRTTKMGLFPSQKAASERTWLGAPLPSCASQVGEAERARGKQLPEASFPPSLRDF